MKLLDFLGLAEDEQYKTLFEKGALVAIRTDEPIMKKLYCINSFYVELHTHHQTEDILFKKIFKEGELLDSYLERFSLNN